MIKRRQVFLGLKFVVAIAAFAYVTFLINWERSISVLRHANWYWLLLSYGLSLLGMYGAALRWIVLLRAVKKFYSLISAYRAYLTGAFYGLAMPGVIGGDAVRVWLCYREIDASVSLVTATVLLERALGVLALLLLLSCGISFFPVVNSGLGAGIAPSLAIIGLFGIAILPSLLRRIALSEGEGVQGRYNSYLITLILKGVKGLAPINTVRIKHLLIALTLSIIFQVFDIAVTFCIAQALEIKLSVFMLLVAMPIVYLATVLPISPGGLGVREGALVFVLTQFDISAPDAALLALVVFINRAAIGILGGLQYLVNSEKLAEMKNQDN